MVDFIARFYLRRKNNLAYYDQLLGVYNRNWLESHRDQLTEIECDVIVVDMNCMKYINDNYGHEIGDELLKVAMGAAKVMYRQPDDAIIRFGGDEFLICSPHTDESLLITAMPAYYFSYGKYHKLAGEDISQAMKIADNLMYNMKTEFHKQSDVPNRKENP